MINNESIFWSTKYLKQTSIALGSWNGTCRSLKFGKLPIIHGDTTFRRGSGVNPAKTLYDRVKQSAIASHVHQVQSYTTKNQFDEEVFTCWTTGHLMHPNVEYCKHVDNYSQGFAILEKDVEGYYSVQNKRIYKNKIF